MLRGKQSKYGSHMHNLCGALCTITFIMKQRWSEYTTAVFIKQKARSPETGENPLITGHLNATFSPLLCIVKVLN